MEVLRKSTSNLESALDEEREKKRRENDPETVRNNPKKRPAAIRKGSETI